MKRALPRLSPSITGDVKVIGYCKLYCYDTYHAHTYIAVQMLTDMLPRCDFIIVIVLMVNIFRKFCNPDFRQLSKHKNKTVDK